MISRNLPRCISSPIVLRFFHISMTSFKRYTLDNAQDLSADNVLEFTQMAL